jgi:hypothetical protein
VTAPPATQEGWRLVGDAFASHRLALVVFVAVVAGLLAASQVIPMLFAPRAPLVAGGPPAGAAKAVNEAGVTPATNPADAAKPAPAAPVTQADPVAGPAAPAPAATSATTIPDVSGETLGTAIASLRERGLTPVPAEATASVAAARVRTTSPPANARAGHKDSVTIWVEIPDGPEGAQVLADLGARDVLGKLDGVWVEQAPWKAPAPIMLEIKPVGSRVSMSGEIRRLQTLAAPGRITWVLSRPLSEACPEASRLAGRKYDGPALETTFSVTLAAGATPSLTLVGATDWKVPCKDHPAGVERVTWRLGPQGS